MMNKDMFLKRKFLYDLQCPIAGFGSIAVWFLIALAGFSIEINFLKMSTEDSLNSFWMPYLGTSPFLIFGFYNLFTYIWSKKMADKYGIELFGDLDQEWLKKEQGYDSKIFGEIYSKNLHFRKLGAKSLYIMFPLSFVPWPAVPFIIGVLMIVVYLVYRNVYFNNAMADRWPRVYGSGIVISRILGQDDPIDQKKKDENDEK